MYEGHSINRGNFFDWSATNYMYEGHSINKGNFFDWRATNYMHEGHSINIGNFLTEEQPIICMRDIQYIEWIFWLKSNQLYVWGTFNIYKGIFFDWRATNYMYEGHSINKGNFFDWRATNYMYEGHSIYRGNFLTEEQPIICMRDIQ